MDRVITVDDVIRAGACADGTYKVAARLREKLAAAMSVSAVIALLRNNEQQYAIAAGEIDGYGSGYGYGYGYGSGYGDGYGYGYGYGYGSGYGDGYGYGYGYGYDGDGAS